MPRALVLGTLALGLTYLLVNAAYLHVLGLPALSASALPAADVAARLFGAGGEAAFLILAVFAALGSLNGAALSAPRVAYALARSRLAPEPLTRVSRVGTPDIATLYFAAAWTLYAWFGSFEGLVSVSVFVGALANVAVTASLFRHRSRDRGGESGIFRVPFHPVLPLIMLLFWGVFAAAVLYQQGWKVGYGLAVVALALPAYFLLRRKGEWRDGDSASPPGVGAVE
jgi:APA family basic amino acid/polyamine antiporter